MKAADKELKDQLEESAGESSINIDQSKFGAKEEAEPEVDASDGLEESMDLTLENLGITKDEIIEMIMELSDNGFLIEEVSIFGGKVKACFKTSTLSDTKQFVDLFDKLEMNTQSRVEYYINLYSLAAVLDSYNNTSLGDKTMDERVDWITENIPTPMYKSINKLASVFHQKIEFLSSEEVASFF